VAQLSGEPAEAEQTPGATATPEPSEVRYGKVNDAMGLRVRSGPTTEGSELDTLPNGQRVRIACVAQGEYVSDVDSDQWYRILYHQTSEGYVSAPYIELEGLTIHDIPECE
jgi:hypothetical protein